MCWNVVSTWDTSVAVANVSMAHGKIGRENDSSVGNGKPSTVFESLSCHIDSTIVGDPHLDLQKVWIRFPHGIQVWSWRMWAWHVANMKRKIIILSRNREPSTVFESLSCHFDSTIVGAPYLDPNKSIQESNIIDYKGIWLNWRSSLDPHVTWKLLTTLRKHVKLIVI